MQTLGIWIGASGLLWTAAGAWRGGPRVLLAVAAAGVSVVTAVYFAYVVTFDIP